MEEKMTNAIPQEANAPVDEFAEFDNAVQLPGAAVEAPAVGEQAAVASEGDELAPAANSEEVSLNQSAEFLRKFATAFSDSFVLALPSKKLPDGKENPNRAIVDAAIKDAYNNSAKKLEAQNAKENKRRAELTAKWKQLHG